MNRAQIIGEIETLLDEPVGSLSESQLFRSLKQWDSLTSVELLALADDQLGVLVNVDNLAKCQTIGDIVDMLEELVAAKAAQ